MRIENSTHWRTDDLRKVILRVAKDRLLRASRHPFLLRNILVRIVYGRSRGSSVGGYAYLNGGPVILSLSKQDRPDPHSLAQTAAHEFDHARGLRHGQMVWIKYEWARDPKFRIRQRGEGAPQKSREERVEDRRLQKIALAESKVLSWSRKGKLAATKIRIWKRRLATLQRRAALPPKKQEATNDAQ